MSRRNSVLLIWHPLSTWLKAITCLKWTRFILVCSAPLVLRESVSSFSHYFHSAHVMLQLPVLGLLSLEWKLDLDLTKDISGGVSIAHLNNLQRCQEEETHCCYF